LGKNVAAAREARGLTQVELAKRLGTTSMTVSRWERGVMEPGALDLLDLGRVLHVGIASLASAGPRDTTPGLRSPAPR